jgi:hypothetical protein
MNNDLYIKSESKQFGNLHERMKWLLLCHENLKTHVDSINDESFKIAYQNLSVAIMDLETEVSYSSVASPPYGRRHIPV